MPSLKSRLLYFTMHNMHLLHGKLKREAWDWNTSVAAFRAECAKSAGVMAKLPEGVTVEPVKIPGLPEGLNAEWLIPSGGNKEQVIFYTHGGGYVSGDCADHRAIVAKLAQASGFTTLLYDYRLAPEHPFPAALDDTLVAYQWLLDQGIDPANILIVGESAGGGLCLCTLLALRDKGMPLPAAAVAMSPYTDLTLSGESYRTRVKQCLSPEGMAVVCSKYYYGDTDPRNPWISPLFGDLHGLPPMLIFVGDWETLRDDSTRFAEKARAAGVDVTLHVGEGMIHCYPLLAPFFPEATEAMAEICTFLKARVGKVQVSNNQERIYA